MKPIIRTEVQVTPKIDLLGNAQYHWRVYQLTDGIEISLQIGFEPTIAKAFNRSHFATLQYI